MINIEKQITHWRKGAENDLEFAQFLIEKRRVQYGLFFAHLELEKILKTLVIKQTHELAPKIHNL